jgi:hypothetical protein
MGIIVLFIAFFVSGYIAGYCTEHKDKEIQ